MIKTLKSELTLRPTYDELIGLINQQGDENRPPIEKVIDRRATLFRNNQFGSQFDNVDFLGLKKQEEDKVKEELRQTQLRQTAMATGSSMAILSYGGRTPVGAYNADGFETPDSDYRMTAEQIHRVRAELDMGLRRQQEAQQASSSSARSDLSDATSQCLPAGIPIHSMVTDEDLPPLVNIEEGEEEEDFEEDVEVVDTQQIKEILDGLKMNASVKSGIKFDLNKMNLNDWSTINPKLMKRDTIMTMFKIADIMGRLNNEQKETLEAINRKLKTTDPDTPERIEVMKEAQELFINAFHDDDPELIPAGDDETTKATGIPRRHKETIDYNENIDRWKNKDVSVDDILYQLHLRGIQLTEEQKEETANLKIKGKGRTRTKKDYLVNFVERLIQTGKWTDEINDQLLRSRMEEWRNMKKCKGGSSSSGIRGAIASGAKAVGSAVLDAGKEAVKEAVVAGARSAVMSLIYIIIYVEITPHL